MIPMWARAWGTAPGSARIRCRPEDFQVSEQLGFEPSGEGEHVFLHLQKRQLNSTDLLQRIAQLSNVAPRDIGFSGLKDRNAITRQWFSVGMAGRAEPEWRTLEAAGDVQLLESGRHIRKLKRGVHRANQFTLVLREVRGDRTALEKRLQKLREQGVPNYFGEQRFGRNGSTFTQARRWMSGGRRVSREKRGLYFSALRAFLFNTLLSERVASGQWDTIKAGDVCLLQGTRSFFTCDEVSDDIRERVSRGDIHAGLPLWGRAQGSDSSGLGALKVGCLAEHEDICAFLERSGLELAWRPARLLPDDFCWQFCDDGILQLNFSLGAGSYATALLAELVQYKEGCVQSGNRSEHG